MEHRLAAFVIQAGGTLFAVCGLVLALGAWFEYCNAFDKMHDWLALDHADTAFAMAGFILQNTLSDNGGVTRGVCSVEAGHTHVVDVVETENMIVLIPWQIVL